MRSFKCMLIIPVNKTHLQRYNEGFYWMRCCCAIASAALYPPCWHPLPPITVRVIWQTMMTAVERITTAMLKRVLLTSLPRLHAPWQLMQRTGESWFARFMASLKLWSNSHFLTAVFVAPCHHLPTCCLSALFNEAGLCPPSCGGEFSPDCAYVCSPSALCGVNSACGKRCMTSL